MVGDHSDESEPLAASASPDAPGSVGPEGDPALDLGYTVTVDSFSGPLDLLLYLVRRTELDILEVPLSLIVDQFVDTVRSWQDADLDVAGEFILMAATLLELKARTIAPPLEQPEEGAEDEPMFDPRESLLRSLLAYRRFKEAAQGLNDLEEARRPLLERQFREHVPEAPPEEGDFDLGEIDLSLLATTCERILSRIGGLGPRTVVVDEMPLGVRIATMLDELAVRERATIAELLAGNTSRVVHITTVMATLELARQRFVEVAQPEQFGDIALRLRTAEEREREPELPPPEPEGPKRRKKLPLVTWHAPTGAPAGAAEPTTDEAADDAPEEIVESDEQRFLRELEEATRVTAVLALTADVEKSFTEHWYTLHPELKPAPAPVVQPESVAVPTVKRPPPKRRAPSEATPAAEAPTPAPGEAAAQPVPAGEVVIAAPAVEAPATVTAEHPAIADAITAVPAQAPAVGAEPPAAAEPLAVTPTEAPAVVTEPPAVASDVIATASAGPVPMAVAETSAAPAAVAPSATVDPSASSPVAARPVGEEPVAVVPPPVREVAVEEVVQAPVADSPVPAAEPLEVVAVAAVESPVPVDSAQPVTVASSEPGPQPVLPVEQWPVLHAQPAAEETPHPLDVIASDDPAAVNEALGAQPRPAAPVDDAAEEDAEDEDPDDLLADDPALVNAALQADQPRPVIERRPVSDVLIPPPTETTVWAAPVDRGQTASGIEDEVVPGNVPPDAVGGEQEAGGVPSVTDHQPAFGDERSVPSDGQSAATAQLPTPGDDQQVASDAKPVPVEPTPSTEPLRLEGDTTPSSVVTDDGFEPDDQDVDGGTGPVDPALVEASQHAAAPRSVELHPVHDLTIPTATETTVWTAPVDHGQTAAGLGDEDDSAETIAVAPAIIDVTEVSMPPPAAPVAVAAVPSAPPLSDPTPTTAPLVLSAPPSEPIGTPSAAPTADLVVAVTGSAVVTDPPPARPVPVARVPDPPPPDSPPVEPPPPLPPTPPPTVRSDSPNPAPTTSPTKPSPMSPPPRSKLWLLIAIFIAINAGWAGVLWATWLPRAVLEVAATERAGTPEQETLTWRFNLDVVDAVAQAKPPELVPVITPAIPGRWHWSDARTLVFDAAGRLPLGTTFTATLPAEDFRTVHGFRLRAAGTQTWSTAALGAGDATVETFTREGTIVTLSFNQPVDPLAIAQELSVELTPVAEPAFATAAGKPPEVAASQPATSAPQPAVVDVVPSAVTSQVVGQQPATSEQQPVSVEVAPVAPVAIDAGSQPLAAGDQQPAAVESAPVVVTPDADGAQPVPGEQQAVVAQAAQVAVTPDATSTSPAVSTQPSSPVVQVRAITSEASSTIRLLIATPVRGTAKLRLPAGTRGVEGPLGLIEAWERQVALRQTLVLDSAITEVPSHGDIRVDVAVSDPQAPRELLVPMVTVEPAVPVTVSTTDAGLSLSGAFVPGQTYRIRAASTWPDEPSTSGHVLAAYTSASEVVVVIPPRPAGIWPVDGDVVDGQTRFAAHAVERADVLLLTSEDECVVSREVAWTGPETAATLDLDDLTDTQPSGTYRLRVRTQDEAPTTSDQTLHIDEVRVRPQALVAALSDWLLAGLAGEEHADVRVRVVRLAGP